MERSFSALPASDRGQPSPCCSLCPMNSLITGEGWLISIHPAMGRGAVCWLRRWVPLLLIWLVATVADRAWLAADQAVPAWDQARHLNSALDHGRALGLLPGGEWPGWQEFLSLSSWVPPLASLVHGTVVAVAGEGPDQASWALALWHGLLLLALDGWGRQLHSPRLAILALILAAVTPGLVSLRVNFTLDLALAAVTTLALWQLWRWQRPAPHGGGIGFPPCLRHWAWRRRCW